MWTPLLGASGILLGLVTYGRRVISTIGNNITHLNPSRGFSVTLSATITVVLSSAIGLPVSTTHTLIGSIIGVGIAKGIQSINLSTIRNIFISWLITIPAGAILSILFFYAISFSIRFVIN
jgi:PiT family inorganic phosphate transporter